jgi:hypothetical protein
VFTAPLHSNGHGADHIENTALLLLREFISAGTCFPSRCLAMNVYCGSVTPAFRHHVTILNNFSRHWRLWLGWFKIWYKFRAVAIFV